MQRFLLASLLFLSPCIVAQNSVVTFPGGFRATQTNSPLSLVLEQKHVQTLADGTTITHTTHEYFYRDSLGRTRTENEIDFSAGMNRKTRFVIVQDPVKGVRLTWQSGGQSTLQEYTRTELAAPGQRPARPASTAQGARPTPQPSSVRPPQAEGRLKPQTTEQDLGNTTVQGETCHARLHTTTFPVNFFGNDRPITTTDESCMSAELGRVLEEVHDDPRTGKQTVSVQSISRAEPDPSLFLAPAGYTERVRQDR